MSELFSGILFRIWLATISVCFLPLNIVGQEADSICTDQPKGAVSLLKQKLRSLQYKLESSFREKVDEHYIEVPSRPWRIILWQKNAAFDLDYHNTLDFLELGKRLEWSFCFEPPQSTSVGLWAGYRGTGMSISKTLTKDGSLSFSLGSTGVNYGVNIRLKYLETSVTTFSAKIFSNGQLSENMEVKGNLPSPVTITSAYINGYYVFNGRHYSQAAAYDQSVIQRRSAGSIVVGATWYSSSFDYSDVKNALFMMIGHNIRRIKFHQANIGVGYGYNFVPFRGFVANAMVMPTISFYNRVKVYKYGFNYEFASSEGQVDDYGDWNPQKRLWDNGKPLKPMTMDEMPSNKLDYWDVDSETEHGASQFNVDLRFGLAYNWKNYFIALQAQYNSFAYKKDDSKVKVYDAYARIALGMRL